MFKIVLISKLFFQKLFDFESPHIERKMLIFSHRANLSVWLISLFSIFSNFWEFLIFFSTLIFLLFPIFCKSTKIQCFSERINELSILNENLTKAILTFINYCRFWLYIIWLSIFIAQNSRKSKCCSKLEILFKNRNFGQKSKFCSKIEILVKNRNFGQKSKFGQKSLFLVLLFMVRIFYSSPLFCAKTRVNQEIVKGFKDLNVAYVYFWYFKKCLKYIFFCFKNSFP